MENRTSSLDGVNQESLGFAESSADTFILGELIYEPPLAKMLDVRRGIVFPFTKIEVKVRRRYPGSCRSAEALAAITLPVTSAPRGTIVLPPTITGSSSRAEKDSPT